MIPSATHRPAVLASALVIGASALLIPTSAQAQPPLKCQAAVSDKTPQQYTNVIVYVRSPKYAKVRTVAHYKTTNNAKATTADKYGKARRTYNISGATPGYRVRVDVTVRAYGRSRTCSTAYTPHK